MRHCVEVDDLKAFLNADDDRKQFYRQKNRYSLVSRVSLFSTDNLLDAVASRVYDIRCRIVHSKTEQSPEEAPILPFSSEEAQLRYDVELVRFLTQKAIVAGANSIG